MDQLQEAFEKVTNQARFVQMIIDKQLIVSNRKKADIVVDLRKHNFRTFKKVAQAKAAGEGEAAADDPDAESEPEGDDTAGTGESGSDFDYLLGMHIYSLTKERVSFKHHSQLSDIHVCFGQIAKLKQQGAEKEAELKAMLQLSPKDLWNVDLDNFILGWEVSPTTFVHPWGIR